MSQRIVCMPFTFSVSCIDYSPQKSSSYAQGFDLVFVLLWILLSRFNTSMCTFVANYLSSVHLCKSEVKTGFHSKVVQCIFFFLWVTYTSQKPPRKCILPTPIWSELY